MEEYKTVALILGWEPAEKHGATTATNLGYRHGSTVDVQLLLLPGEGDRNPTLQL